MRRYFNINNQGSPGVEKVYPVAVGALGMTPLKAQVKEVPPTPPAPTITYWFSYLTRPTV